jgi:hypothetical protein
MGELKDLNAIRESVRNLQNKIGTRTRVEDSLGNRIAILERKTGQLLDIMKEDYLKNKLTITKELDGSQKVDEVTKVTEHYKDNPNTLKGKDRLIDTGSCMESFYYALDVAKAKIEILRRIDDANAKAYLDSTVIDKEYVKQIIREMLL